MLLSGVELLKVLEVHLTTTLCFHLLLTTMWIWHGTFPLLSRVDRDVLPVGVEGRLSLRVLT